MSVDASTTTPAKRPSLLFLLLCGLVAVFVITLARLIYGASWLAGAVGIIFVTGAQSGYRRALPFATKLQTSVNGRRKP